MNILLLGSGGREHALAWKLAQSRAIKTDGGVLWAAPGNPGIGELARLTMLDLGDHDALVRFCLEARIGLVVIGPEAPLVDGLADSLRARHIPVFGPSAAAARLEGSKSFTKALCERAGIPTAGHRIVTSLAQGRTALSRFTPPYVLKADGLAAGKGVVIAPTLAEAEDALGEMLGGRFGDAGEQVVIEEFMAGEEASLFVLTDGHTILPFGTAQDHKRAFDGDRGPNTGGMGAYSPAAILTAQLEHQAMKRIIIPTIRLLAAESTPYSGMLYAGLMLTAEGPKLVEYNCRLGDPECQALMLRFEGDLAETLLTCATGALAESPPPRFSGQQALTVVLAARGYPEAPVTGGRIEGLERAALAGARVFQAGTAQAQDGGLVASGGRVLSVSAAGDDLNQARQRAYAGVRAIDFADGFWRNDIGQRRA